MNSSVSVPVSPLQRLHGYDTEPRSLHVLSRPPRYPSLTMPKIDASSSNIQFSIKKILPIKKSDAQMLTRDDVQFDLLHAIFSDQTKAFTDQTGGKSSSKITFSQLYINALYQSNKCSKVLKDKMKETPAFAIELAKISLLANVGRINTTMACAHIFLFEI